MKEQKHNLEKWERDVLWLKKYYKKKKLTQEFIAERTGLIQPNISRIFNLQYSPTLKNLIPIVEAMGLHIEYVENDDPVIAARREEINDLFRQHFKMPMPAECKTLSDIMTLVNKLHFKHPTWYDAFVASILDIWKSYEEDFNPEDTNI